MPQKNTDWNELGKQIEIVRERRVDYSLYRLAKDAKIDYSYLYRLMHDHTINPSKKKIVSICRALRCSVQEAAAIFDAAGYRAPTPEELQDEAEEKPAA